MEIPFEEISPASNHFVNDQNDGVQDLFSPNQNAQLVKSYLEEIIPKEIREGETFKHFWAVLGNTVKLSFLSREDVDEFENLFDQATWTFIMSRPSYEYTFDDMMLIRQLRIYFLAAIKRAVGGKNGTMNERSMLATSIQQQIRSYSEGGQKKKGFLGGWF